jgi:hypothetical protein
MPSGQRRYLHGLLSGFAFLTMHVRFCSPRTFCWSTSTTNPLQRLPRSDTCECSGNLIFSKTPSPRSTCTTIISWMCRTRRASGQAHRTKTLRLLAAVTFWAPRPRTSQIRTASHLLTNPRKRRGARFLQKRDAHVLRPPRLPGGTDSSRCKLFIQGARECAHVPIPARK